MTSLDRRKDSHRGEVSLEERNLEALLDTLGWALDEAAEEARQRSPVPWADVHLGQELLVQDIQSAAGFLRDQLAADPAAWKSPGAHGSFVFLTERPGGNLHVGIWVRLTGEAKWVQSDEGGWWLHLPDDVERTLDNLDPEERERRVSRLVAPQRLSIDVEVCQGEARRQAVFHLDTSPWLWIPKKSMAKLPFAVSLETDVGWDTWPDQERPAVFEALDNACEQLLEAIHKTREEALGERIRHLKNPGPPSSLETRTFPLAFQETRLHLDPEVREILGAAHRLRGFPQHWSKVPRWTDLERTRVEELVAGGVERAREAGLLAKQETVNPENGAKIYRLTPRGKRELELEAGTKKSGYRVVQEDGNEYLCRTFLLPSGNGHLELGFSFHGLAGPWVESWRREQAKEASKAQKELDGLRQKPLLFDELNEEREKDLVRFLEHVRRIDRSQEVLKLILEQVWDQKQNPVMLPAVVFRELLGLHAEAHWKQHVEGVLDFLLGCRMSHRTSTSKEQGRGTLLTHWRYKPAGPGDHAAGDYWLTMNPAFLVSYEVWKTGTVQEDGRTVTLYETGRRLEAEERKALDYQKAFTGHPFVARAAGLTRTQSNLLAWLEDAITLQGQPTRKGRPRARKGSKEAQLPRLYEQDFCPLLPAGEGFVGALGRFRNNPESGRTLFGTRTRGSSKSGAHAAGLLEEMGHLLPPGGAHRRREAVVREALQDLRRVVQGCLGGVVACYDQDKHSWLTLDQAEKRSLDQLKRVRFLCFLAPDYRDRLTRSWEEKTVQEARQGRRAHAWRATADPQEADQARLALQTGHREKPRPEPELVQGSEVWTPDMDPLWARLASAQRERGLSQKELGRLFGVDRSRVARWTKNPSPESGMKGEPVPAYLAPLVLRWVETGEAPTPEELATLDRRNAPAGGVQGESYAEPR